MLVIIWRSRSNALGNFWAWHELCQFMWVHISALLFASESKQTRTAKERQLTSTQLNLVYKTVIEHLPIFMSLGGSLFCFYSGRCCPWPRSRSMNVKVIYCNPVVFRVSLEQDSKVAVRCVLDKLDKTFSVLRWWQHGNWRHFNGAIHTDRKLAKISKDFFGPW